MDDLSFKLLQFMKEDFGDLGPFFLSKEMKEIGLNDLNNLNQEQKDLLVEHLLRNVFAKSMSAQKLAMKKSYLESIIKEEHEKKEELTQKEKTRILMGNPKVSSDSAFSSTKQEEKKEIQPDQKKSEPTRMAFLHSPEQTIEKTKETIPRGKKLFVLFLGIFIVGFIVFAVLNKIAIDKSENSSIKNTIALPLKNVTQNVTGNGTSNVTQNTSIEVPELPTPQNVPIIIDENASSVLSENQSSTTASNQSFLSNQSNYQNTSLPNALNSSVSNNTPSNFTNENTPLIQDTSNEEQNTPSQQPTDASCSIVNQGSIFFDSATKHFYGCDGSSWKQLDN